MNRLLFTSILCGGLVAGATCLRAETAAKPAGAATSTNQVAAVGKAQTNCPVMPGNPINKALFVDVEGKRIYVCCSGCVGAIKKDPKKYIQQLEASGVVLEKTPVAPAKP